MSGDQNCQSLWGTWLLLPAFAACDGTLDPVQGDRLPEGVMILANPREPDEVSADVVLTVRTDQELAAIAPWIYGINGALDDGILPTLTRHVGNRWTAYNWENNASNAGEYFEYQNDDFLSDSDVPGAALQPHLDAARTRRLAAIVSIPILGHVAADKLGGGDVRDSGADYLDTRFRDNVPTNPAGPELPPVLTDPAVYQDDFVRWARAGWEGSDVLFELDVEPELWHRTHPELQPAPLRYDEHVDRTLRFARAVKSAWPAAPVLGLGANGWSAWEKLEGSGAPTSDPASKGPYLEYWLAALAAAEREEGIRLVDYVDLNWYSEARAGDVGIRNEETSPEVVAARLQAPRSLWDPSYVEQSWITETATDGEPIRWIPRLRERIARAYPGTRFAVGAWSFGGGNAVSGALAAADALGAFGRHGVELAAHAAGPGPYVRAAFAAFRDFDGQGGRFGDTALTAVSEDVATLSVYGSLDWARPERVVVLVINKAPHAVTTGLRLAHPTTFSAAATWVLDGSEPALREGPSLAAVGTNTFRWTLPAHSLCVLVPDAG